MKKRKILLFINSLYSAGAERVFSILSNYLNEREDIELHIVMIDNIVMYDLPKTQNFKIFKPSKTENPKNPYWKFLELPLLALRLSKYIKENDIDIAVSFLYRANYINLISKLLKSNHKAVINIRSTTSRYLKEGVSGKVNLFLIKNLFNLADLIISNSYGVKKDLETLFEIKTRHISIPNPLNIDKIQRLRKEKDEKYFLVDENKKYIISVGRLIPLKRNKDLIDAFRKIKGKIDEDINLLFLGDGALKEELKDYVKKSDIENRVLFLGNVKNPFYYLDKSLFFVLTSETEGFPNVLTEAMACNLPVISSNCKSGPSEILDNGKYGFLYEVGDVAGLSELMLNLIKDGELRNKYSTLAFNRAKDYKLDNIMKLFYEAIKEV